MVYKKIPATNYGIIELYSNGNYSFDAIIGIMDQNFIFIDFKFENYIIDKEHGEGEPIIFTDLANRKEIVYKYENGNWYILIPQGVDMKITRKCGKCSLKSMYYIPAGRDNERAYICGISECDNVIGLPTESQIKRAKEQYKKDRGKGDMGN